MITNYCKHFNPIFKKINKHKSLFFNFCNHLIHLFIVLFIYYLFCILAPLERAAVPSMFMLPKENSSTYTSDGEKIHCGLKFTKEGIFHCFWQIFLANRSSHI